MALSTLTYGLFRAPISPPTGAPHASAGKVWIEHGALVHTACVADASMPKR